GQVRGEYERGSAAVGPPDHRDDLVRQARTRVGGLDLRVAPVCDLPEEDSGIDVARELEPLHARDVVGERDLAGGQRHELNAAGDLRDLLVGHRGVAGREIYRVVDEVLDAGAASFRLIINGNGAVLAAERLEPRRVKREWKARPGAGEPHPLLRRRLPGPEREYRDAGRQQERDRQSFHGWSSVEFLNELPVGL